MSHNMRRNAPKHLSTEGHRAVHADPETILTETEIELLDRLLESHGTLLDAKIKDPAAYQAYDDARNAASRHRNITAKRIYQAEYKSFLRDGVPVLEIRVDRG